MLKISEVLSVKGDTLYTANPCDKLSRTIETMSMYELGAILVMEHGELVGILTFREVIDFLGKQKGGLDITTRSVMNDAPITVSPNTPVTEVQRLMLDHHIHYAPVMEGKNVLGVISFADMTQAVLKMQSFENQMLKAYIKNISNDDNADE